MQLTHQRLSHWEINGTKKRIREMDASGSTLQYSNVLNKGKKKMHGTSVATYNAAIVSLNMNMNAGGPSERLEVPLEKSNGTARKRVREMRSTLKKCSTVSEKESDSSGSMIEKKSLAINPQSIFPCHSEGLRMCLNVVKIIPCEFVRECLPRANKKFTLWDPQGKAWEVNYFYFSERSAGAFSAGWGKFSLGNHLEKFDLCVFELFSQDNLKVHIYGANPEITPFVPGSSNK